MSGQRESAIVVAGLCKSFGRTPVLRDVELTVAAGSVFALLGPNGAGKTTIVRILSTLIAPDAGEARVAGHDVLGDPDAVRAAIGVTGQFSAVDELLTGEENLRLMADLHHLGRVAGPARVAELLERFDLVDAARRSVSTYSGGMRRRLDLAASLMRRPHVLFLDEPTTGLDPRSRRQLWSLVGSLVADGVTVFLTTQYLDEADALADRIAVLDRGRIVAEGSASELKAAVAGRRLVIRAVDSGAVDALTRAAGARVVDRDPALLTLGIACDGEGAAVRALLDELDPDRSRIADFSVRTATLDDVFLTLTGHTTTAESEAIDD
jgi:ABC-2 type transport system ATP-binding protein